MRRLIRTIWPPVRLPDRLPFDFAIDERTIFTKIGGFLRVAHIVPPDLQAASAASIDTHYDMLARLLGRLDTGWTIHIDQWRWLLDANLELRDYGGNLAAQLVDQDERRQFAGDKAFDNSIFFAVHYEPDKARNGLMEHLASEEGNAFSTAAMYRRFNQEIDKLFGELALLMPHVDVLEGEGLWSYLSQTVNYEPWPMAEPAIPVDLSRAVGSSRWRGGTKPTVNDVHVRTVELFSIGHLTADTIQMLHNLPFECRWTIRIDTADRYEQGKWLSQMRKESENRRQNIGRRMVEHFTRRPEPSSNPAAELQIIEIDQLHADVTLGDTGFAPITLNVRVWNNDPRVAEERAQKVELELKKRSFRAETASINAVGSMLSDVPGNDASPREVPALFAQIVRLSPLTGASRGSDKDSHWQGPALLLGSSDAGVPIRFSWHSPGEDNGNTAIIGQSGGGKSVLIAKAVAATMKYDRARAIVFDIGKSFMLPCLCLGGDWIELGEGEPCVQPLRHIHNEGQFRVAHEWLCAALAYQGVERTDEVSDALTAALRLVARLPADKRTISALVDRIGASIQVREALRGFTRHGHWGSMFDGTVASYGSASVVGVECGSIRTSPVLPLLVSAMFDALRYERLDGSAPSLVVFDEFHELIRRSAFSEEVDRIAREIRKLNGVMVLATQSAADLTDKIAAVVEGQCKNLILTPNPEALEDNQARFYRALGLSDDRPAAARVRIPEVGILRALSAVPGDGCRSSCKAMRWRSAHGPERAGSSMPTSCSLMVRNLARSSPSAGSRTSRSRRQQPRDRPHDHRDRGHRRRRSARRRAAGARCSDLARSRSGLPPLPLAARRPRPISSFTTSLEASRRASTTRSARRSSRSIAYSAPPSTEASASPCRPRCRR